MKSSFKSPIQASLLLIFTFLFLSGCNSFDTKPHLTLSDNRLEIADFQWTYGTVELNHFTGDFEKLDHKVFDLLQGKEGIIKVDLQQNNTDRYGTNNSSLKYIGEINLVELNKYQNWEYWHKDNGIRKLIYDHIIHVVSASDSTVITTVDTANKINVVPQKPSMEIQRIEKKRSNVKEYNFTFESLYPDEQERNLLNVVRFDFSGVISSVNFNEGIMKVNAKDGNEYILQFYPLNGSSNTQNNLRLALKEGNRITGVYTIAGANSSDLISATISER